MFTVRVKLLPFESLTSYMMRFSSENGVNLLSYWNAIRNEKAANPQKSDLDSIDLVPATLLDFDQMEKATQILRSELLQGSMYYVLKKFCHSKELGHSRFIKGLIRNELHFCPKCLAEKAYHKLYWRIDGIDCCPEHHCYLLQGCQHCNEVIKMNDIVHIGICPHCNNKLSCNNKMLKVSDKIQEQQSWLTKAWRQLFNKDVGNDIEMSCDQIALKIVYLLNDQRNVFDRRFVEKGLKPYDIKINTILQYARDSLSQKRMLHLNFVLKVLYDNNLDILSFFEMQIPDEFIKSVCEPKQSKLERAVCLSPWCSSYKEGKSLVKTGTLYKRYINSEVLSHHLACLDCGCDYAFNTEGRLVERSYFGAGYEVIKDRDPYDLTLAELSRRTGYKITASRRIIAYFQSRGILNGFGEVIETSLQNKFINAIKNNIRIAEIEKWDCWENINHYLLHRYHPALMREMILFKRPSKNRLKMNEIWDQLILVCSQFLEKDKDITIESISIELGVSEKTLRKWGFHTHIKEMKEKQRAQRLELRKAMLYDRIDNFFEENAGERVLSKDIYIFLGVQQSYLCDVAPDLNKYISEKRQMYNDQL